LYSILFSPEKKVFERLYLHQTKEGKKNSTESDGDILTLITSSDLSGVEEFTNKSTDVEWYRIRKNSSFLMKILLKKCKKIIFPHLKYLIQTTKR